MPRKVVAIRLNEYERERIQMAADVQQRTAAEFIRDAALRCAESVIEKAKK